MPNRTPSVRNPANFSPIEDVCAIGGDKGGDISNCGPSKQNHEYGINTSQGGYSWSKANVINKRKHKESWRRKKQVIIGRNFLLIDSSLRKTLKVCNTVEFFHRSSLSVTKRQVKQIGQTNMDID